jgi:hypothetical protein
MNANTLIEYYEDENTRLKDDSFRINTFRNELVPIYVDEEYDPQEHTAKEIRQSIAKSIEDPDKDLNILVDVIIFNRIKNMNSLFDNLTICLQLKEKRLKSRRRIYNLTSIIIFIILAIILAIAIAGLAVSLYTYLSGFLLTTC